MKIKLLKSIEMFKSIYLFPLHGSLLSPHNIFCLRLQWFHHPTIQMQARIIQGGFCLSISKFQTYDWLLWAHSFVTPSVLRPRRLLYQGARLNYLQYGVLSQWVDIFLKYTIRSIVCKASRHPIIWSSDHPVIQSFAHLVIPSSGHSVILPYCHPNMIWSSIHPIIMSFQHAHKLTN